MSDNPEQLRYTESHEWLRQLDHGIAEVGITDHAQSLLGDIVYVELPEVGSTLTAGTEAVVVESVKAASDAYSPVSGEVIEVNESLNETPEIINQDAFGKGWIYRLKLADSSEIDALLNAAAYTLKAAEDDD
ncbi:MAG TPA: glycine cleavage system protein GcvH [Gammaproteobacteria bacterium]|nr:glycine cleavage system protein GcvH [Gammaproteobacteria bacterium]